MFSQNPEKYIPQYGGYCAYAASQGARADIDPIAWRIIDNKLYLNYDLRVQKIWASNLDEYIQADADLPLDEKLGVGAVFAIRPWELPAFRDLKRPGKRGKPG